MEILHGPQVKLIDWMGDDNAVVRAAKVSVQGLNEVHDGEKITGLINYLMKNRHGSPFEHTSMTFFVKAPIFVFREFMRHRIGISYNEMSGRYTTLPDEFYVPAPNRNLVNIGSSAKPEFAPGSAEQYERMADAVIRAYEEAWTAYELMLADGIANEVARIVLPVGIMSQMYVTLNARSMMNFLSLRVDAPEALVRSRPQYEIQQVAMAMEREFASLFPVVYNAFIANGRVAP